MVDNKVTICRVYDHNEERETETEEIGILVLTNGTITYIPENKTWNAKRDTLMQYEDIIHCIIDFNGKSFYLNEADYPVIEKLVKENIDYYLKNLHIPSKQGITCSTCGEDPGVGFFSTSEGDYCTDCYKKKFSTIKETATPKREQEKIPEDKKVTCVKCGEEISERKVFTVDGSYICYHCYYKAKEEE
jgi:hypothetical protein